jgi:hypothetical protein
MRLLGQPWQLKGFSLRSIPITYLPARTMNRNEKSELVYVWGEILLRNMVFVHH